MIQPIETVYKGYKFRSRLEARWAVFFDSIQIEYEYEKEGFDLGKGHWFLPDFYLVAQNCYIEIKPNNLKQINSNEYVTAILNTAELGMEYNSLLIFGNPYFGDYNIVGALKGQEVYGVFAIEERERSKLWIKKNTTFTCLNNLSTKAIIPSDNCPYIISAYNKARQARFEKGSPALYP
jgi:hypothetical protein